MSVIRDFCRKLRPTFDRKRMSTNRVGVRGYGPGSKGVWASVPRPLPILHVSTK